MSRWRHSDDELRWKRTFHTPEKEARGPLLGGRRPKHSPSQPENSNENVPYASASPVGGAGLAGSPRSPMGARSVPPPGLLGLHGATALPRSASAAAAAAPGAAAAERQRPLPRRPLSADEPVCGEHRARRLRSKLPARPSTGHLSPAAAAATAHRRRASKETLHARRPLTFDVTSLPPPTYVAATTATAHRPEPFLHPYPYMGSPSSAATAAAATTAAQQAPWRAPRDAPSPTLSSMPPGGSDTGRYDSTVPSSPPPPLSPFERIHRLSPGFKQCNLTTDDLTDEKLSNEVLTALNEGYRKYLIHQRLLKLQEDITDRALEQRLAERNDMSNVEYERIQRERAKAEADAAIEAEFLRRERVVMAEERAAEEVARFDLGEEPDDGEDLGGLRKLEDADELRRRCFTAEEATADRHQQRVVSMRSQEHWGQHERGRTEEKLELNMAQLEGKIRGKEWNLSHMKLNEFQVAAITSKLVSHTELTTLVLNDNGLSNDGVRMLVDLLRMRRNITHVDLSANPISTHAAEDLAMFLRECDSLQTLRLEGCHMGFLGAQHLAKALCENSGLTACDISNCKLGDDAGVELGNMLLRNHGLLTFKCAWNNFGFKAAKAFAEGLQSSKCTVEWYDLRLDLAHNAMGELGGSFLGHAIRANTSLRMVDLSSNQLAESAALVLGHALKCTQTLEEINLRSNPLGKIGGACILEALSENTSLRHCWLQQCGFTSAAKETVFNARRPDGKYNLDMANPAQRHVVTELLLLRERVLKLEPHVARGIALRKEKAPEPEPQKKGRIAPKKKVEEAPKPSNNSGPLDVWEEPRLDGALVPENELKEWRERPEFIPYEGRLTLKIKWSTSPPPMPTPMEATIFNHVVNLLAHPQAEDKWRQQFVRMVTEVKYVTSQQLALMLKYIGWGTDKIEAVMMAYGRIVDPQNMYLVMQELFAQEQCMLVRQLGKLVLWHPHNLTGSYELSLSRPADFWIAQHLVDASRREGQWRKDPLKINLRNMKIDGVAVPADELLNLDKYELPTHGNLVLDYAQLVFKKSSFPPRASRSHFDRFLQAVIEMEREDAEPTESYRWFPDHAEEKILNPIPTASKARLNPYIPYSVRVGGMGPRAFKYKKKKVFEAANFMKAISSDTSPTKESKSKEKKEKKKKDTDVSPTKGESTAGAELAAELGTAGAPELAAAANFVEEPLPLTPAKHEDSMDSKSMRLLHLMRTFALSHTVTPDMVMSLLGVVGDGCMPHKDGLLPRNSDKVNAVVTFYGRVEDPKEFHHIVRTLEPEDQVAVYQRIGCYNLLNLKRPEGIFYSLRLTVDEEFAVGNKLSVLAIRNTEERTCFSGLTINDREAFVKEDQQMWSTLMVASNFYMGHVAHITFTFVGTGPKISNAMAAIIQKNWRCYVIRLYYLRKKRATRFVETKWCSLLEIRKRREERKQEEINANATDFW